MNRALKITSMKKNTTEENNMPMLYADDADSMTLIEDYLQVEDLFEAGLGRFGRGRSRWGRRIAAQRAKKQVGRQPWQRTDKPATTRFHRGPRKGWWGRVMKKATPEQRDRLKRLYMERKRAAQTAQVARRRARWDQPVRGMKPAAGKRVNAVKLAKCKALLERHGMLSDYLQVEDADLNAGLAGPLDIFKDLMVTIGLRDPLSHYEPGASMSEVYAKYLGMTKDMKNRIGKLGTAAPRGALLDKLTPLSVALAGLKPAFSGMGSPGANDKAVLGGIVQGSRFLKRDLREAEKKYGTGSRAPLPAEPPPPAGVEDPAPITPTKAPPEGMTTGEMVTLGVVALGAIMVLPRLMKGDRKRGGTRRRKRSTSRRKTTRRRKR